MEHLPDEKADGFAFALDETSDQEDRRVVQNGFLALVEIGADDKIGQAGFVLQGDKKMSAVTSCHCHPPVPGRLPMASMWSLQEKCEFRRPFPRVSTM